MRGTGTATGTTHRRAPALAAIAAACCAAIALAAPAAAGSVTAGVPRTGVSPPTAYVVSGAAGTVTPIDTATNTAGTPIPVGSGPWAIAITP